MSTAFPGSPHTMSFVAVSGIMEKWLGNPCISHMKYIVGCESYGENHQYSGKIMSTNYPGSPHTKRFVAFFRTMRYWWGEPCISSMMKYTIGLESNGKKAPILWEKYEYQFPKLSPYHGFCCIFLYCGKFMGQPMHFPYAII